MRAYEVSYLPTEFTEAIIMCSKYIVRRNERVHGWQNVICQARSITVVKTPALIWKSASR